MVLLFALQRLCSVLLKAKLSHISPLAYLRLFQVLQVTPAGYKQTKNVIELSLENKNMEVFFLARCVRVEIKTEVGLNLVSRDSSWATEFFS